MINVKAISISAICGFVLSFISGLFSHSKFYLILIKALIFALIFGALGFLISFLYTKFLAGDSSSDFSSGNESEPSANNNPVKGQKVNLVIQDQDFEADGNDNHFYVGENRQMLNESDYGKSTHFENDSKSSFVPLRKQETVDNISGKEAVSSENLNSAENSFSSPNVSVSNSGKGIPTLNDNSSEGLDVLPDMDNLTMSSDSTAEDDDGDSSAEDTGFSSEDGFSSVSSSRSKNTDSEVQDAGLMAKAISSILSGEK